ncbi:hypothetical protein [Undibacterium sp. TJN19]|uniref:hypothetical protein n=1 Tax=Undibacterium sp. TJN19 TaxID=3413055 RepID=UPI003BEFEE4E
MTKISAFLQMPSDGTRQDRKNDVDSQHENWLRQIELSLMSDLNQHGNVNAGAIRAVKYAFRQETHTESEYQTQNDQVTAANNRQQDMSFKRSIYPVTPSVAKPVDSIASSSAEAAILTTDQARSGNAVDREMLDITASVAEDLSGGIEANSIQMTTVSMKVFDQVASAQNSLPMANGFIENSSLESVAKDSDRMTTINSSLAAMPRTARLMRETAMFSESDQEETSFNNTENEPETSAGAAEQLQDKQAWEKRMMHLITEGKNVNVWIRDQNIETSQTPQLISRLVSEMAASGMRLNGASVNGKLVFKNEEDAEGDKESLTETDRSSIKHEMGDHNTSFNSVKKGQKYGTQ